MSKAAVASDRYLTFNLGSEEYALPLQTVREVIAIPEITPIPHSQPHFLGIMNLRGQVISIVDLRLKFGIQPASSAETAVIICDLSPYCIGIVVDSVNSVQSPAPSEISEKPQGHSSQAIDYITGIYRQDERLILLVDIFKSLSLEERKMISESGADDKASTAA